MDGFDAYLIESMPKPDAPVVWGEILYWVGKNYVPLRAQEFYREGS